MLSVETISVLFACYALGCLCSGYYLVRFRTGRDIREFGSGNVGARNAGCLLGGIGFTVTLLGDMGKGALAVWLAKRVATMPAAPVFAMIAVLLGHLFPVQLRFRGGKGIATTMGALSVLSPKLALGAVAVSGGLVLLTRAFTASGMVASASLPAVAASLGEDRTCVWGAAAAGLLVLFAHRSNIARLLSERGRRHGTAVVQDRDGGVGVRPDPPAQLPHVRGGDPPASSEP